MATVTPGYTFTNNEVVTPAKLNSAATPTVTVDNDEITTAKIADSAITTAKIANGTIVNADINASAAIAGTKVAPNFGSQNVVTAGTGSFYNITANAAAGDTAYISLGTGFTSGYLNFNRANDDMAVWNSNAGILRFGTSNGERMRITSSGDVGIGTTPNAAALLDVASTTKGFLPPRMTTAQRDAISTPPAGLMLYNTSTNKLQVRTNTAWADLH